MAAPAPHPDGCYWANTATHAIQRQCNPFLAGLLGQIGYVGQNGTPPGLGGHAFVKFSDAQAFLSTHDTPGHRLGHDAAQAVPSVGGFLGALSSPNTWVRVGEAVAGLILVAVGVNALAKGTPAGTAIQSATRTARKVATHVPGV